MNAYKIYTTLDLNEKMPQFPFDFMHGMIWCLHPKGWFSTMNPLVDKVIEGKEVAKSHIEKINIKKRNTTIGIASLFIIHAVAKIALN